MKKVLAALIALGLASAAFAADENATEKPVKAKKAHKAKKAKKEAAAADANATK